MAAVILPLQDCLGEGLSHRGLVLSPPLNSRRNSNPCSSSSSANPNFNHDDTTCSSWRRRRTAVKANRQVSRGRSRVGEPSTAAKISPKNLVMGHVKILKRGEMLTLDRGVSGDDSCGKRRLGLKGEDLNLVLGSTDRLGPDPDLMQKQVAFSEFKVVDAIYAGSGAVFASPPPSSVPLPSFLGKNGTGKRPTRLLRLDLG